MTTRALDLARITGKYVEAYDVDRGICHVPWCMYPVVHRHHVMARGPMGGAYDWLEVDGLFLIGNLVGLCVTHHSDVHDGCAAVRIEGRAWEFAGDGRRGLLNPRAPVRTLTEGEESAQALETVRPDEPDTTYAASPSVSVPPGQDCPTCSRRVPHPRKSTSPKSKTFGFRVPLDEVDEFVELLDAAAEHWGVKEKPHHKYRLILDALVLVLQTESKEEA